VIRVATGNSSEGSSSCRVKPTENSRSVPEQSWAAACLASGLSASSGPRRTAGAGAATSTADEPRPLTHEFSVTVDDLQDHNPNRPSASSQLFELDGR
jgi:hypothetical protein